MARLLLGNVRGPQGAQGATGPQGPQGVRGPTGPGVPSGGSQGMALVKTSGTDYDSQWKDLLASPALTGTPTAPTAAAGTKTTQIATTAFATQADEALQEQVTALGNMDTAIEQGIAILATGNTHAAITSGQYVFVRNHSTLANGLYKASANIAANAALSTSNLVADSSGGLNSLKAGLDTLNSNMVTRFIEDQWFQTGDTYTPAPEWMDMPAAVLLASKRLEICVPVPKKIGSDKTITLTMCEGAILKVSVGYEHGGHTDYLSMADCTASAKANNGCMVLVRLDFETALSAPVNSPTLFRGIIHFRVS